jgi:hypothetical protein
MVSVKEHENGSETILLIPTISTIQTNMNLNQIKPTEIITPTKKINNTKKVKIICKQIVQYLISFLHLFSFQTPINYNINKMI